jgi:hypothetical protein
MRCVHYVGFRGDEYARARRIWGGPCVIHMHMDDRVMTEVGSDDVVVIGPRGHTHHDFVWDASAVPPEFTD